MHTRLSSRPIIPIFLLSLIALLCIQPVHGQATQTTPIGAAKVDITPATPVRMYGYASRTNESQAIAGRLKASALAIGDDTGDGPAVLLTVDNGSVPVEIREQVLRRLQTNVRLKPERFMLCNAHIHSGPDLDGMASLAGEQRQHLDRYAKDLTDKLEQLILKALSSRTPGQLAWTSGTVNFAANRRVLKDGKWSGFGVNPDGPVDHSLPLLRAIDSNGKLLAVVINYACHNTTLRQNFEQLHADWAGCAQEFVEADNPGAIALITLGCGADSDPRPHGTVELCQQHGREMANEVKRLLAGQFKPIKPALIARSMPLEIPCDPPPSSLDDLRKAARNSYAAAQWLQMLEAGQKPPASISYPITTWVFGDDLAMVFLSNEVVVDYALRIRREFDGGRLWVNAYSNEVSYYVASNRLLKEGGYEVNNSLSAKATYGRPDHFQPPLEDRIMQRVRLLLPESYRSAPSAPK